jgi:autotransporter-associated beta strand protein
MNTNKMLRYPGPVVALGIVLFLGILDVQVHGATYTWDPTGIGAGGGGTGTWNTASWWNGTSDVLWSGGNDAWFSGTAGTVTLSSPASANNIFFKTSGYVVAGSSITNTLTLSSSVNFPTTGNISDTIAAVLNGGGGLIQSGSGLLTLTGADTYTGATTIGGGTLMINNTNTTSAIGVGLGTKPATLGGSATLSAIATCNAQNDRIIAGSGGQGSLTLGGLNFQNNTARIFVSNLGNYTSSAALVVTGNNQLIANGSQTSISFNLGGTAPLTSSGTVHLVQYSGSLQGTGFSNLTYAGNVLNNASGWGSRSTFSLSTAHQGYIDLVFSQAPLIWTGAGNGIWDVAVQSPTNWIISGSGATNFQANDTVIFDDSAGANTTVSISGTGAVNPSGVTFNNNSASYLIQGAYGITGQSALTMNGAGTVTITNSNSYFGGTIMNAGRLNIGNSAALGSAAATITINGGTLDNSSGGPMATANYPVNWNGGFTFLGSNPLNLGTGIVTIGGTASVNLNNANPLTLGGNLAGTGGITLNGSGILVLGGSGAFTGPTVVNGGTLSAGNGGTGSALNASSGVSLAANTTLIFNHSDTVNFVPAITGGGTVVQSGGLLSLLSGGNSYTGGTVVSGGTLQSSSAGGFGPASGALTVSRNLQAGGGVADLNGINVTVGALNGNGTIDNSAAGPATLTVGNGGAGGTFSGTIQNSAGIVSFVKSGGGTQYLSGTGSFTGATTITGGVLNTTGAALQQSTVNVSINNSLAFSGSAASVGGLSGSGNINLGPTNLAVGANNFASAYAGVISGAGGLTKTGTGVFSLVAAQNYGGATNIAGGTLRIAAAPVATLVGANLIYDLDASVPSSFVLTGGSVTAWNDSSGSNGGNFTSGTAATSAVIAVNGGSAFNGNNVMYFNGTGAATLTSTTSTTPLSVFIVEKVARALSNSDAIWGNAGQSNNIRIGGLNATPYFINPGTPYVDYANSSGSLGANGVFSTGNVPAGAAQLLEANAGNFASLPWAATALSNSSGTTGSFNGYIGEVAAYSGYLSDSDRQQNEAYLMYKWLGIVPQGGANNLLPTTTPLNISNGGTFDMANGTQTVASLSSTDGKGSLVLLGTTGVLTVGGPTSTTFDGSIQGSGGALIKQGNGNLVLNGGNIYGGGTTVTAGTLQLGDGVAKNGSVQGNISISNNSTVVFANPTTQGFNGAVSGIGSFAKTGAGMLVITTTQAYSGSTTINNGSLRLGSGGGIFFTPVSGFGANTTGNNATTNGTWTFNTNNVGATPVTNNVLTLTTAANNQWRSAWYNTRVPVAAFNASFVYTDVSTNGADGVVFVLQSDSRGLSALGATSGGNTLAYSGITPSAAIELNLYNGGNGPASSSVFSTNGTLPTCASTAPVNLDSGHPIQVSLIYDGSNFLVETLTDTTSASLTYSTTYSVGNLATTLGSNTAYVGFTGSCGGSNANQTIGSFSYSSAIFANGGNTLPATTSLSFANGSTLDLYGGPQQVVSLSGTSGAVTNTLPATLATLTVTGPATTTFGGAISDGGGQTALALTAGALTLTGSSNYTGGTTISGAAIVATNSAALGSGAVNLGSGTLNASANGLAVGSLSVAASGASTLDVGLAHPLSIGGGVNLSSGGTLNISGVLYTLPALLIGYSGTQAGTFDSAYYNGGALPSGDSLSYSGGSIEVVGSVTFFSGSGSWIGANSSWNSSGNWIDAFGHHGVPGDGSRPPGTDTVSFSGSSAVTTINLSPTNPNLAALSFSRSNYTLSSGSLTLYSNSGPATITVLSGSSTFNATTTLNLASSTTVNPSIGAQLTINGSITGINPLTLNGPGNLVLGGNSGFGGGLIVQSGTLVVTNDAAVADGSSLIVGSAAAFADPPIPSGAPPVSATAASPVPEPGTLVLLAVAGAFLLLYRRQR